ncbi:MAG: TRAP transporter small permease [Thermodesulfobacteriota bacterium]
MVTKGQELEQKLNKFLKWGSVSCLLTLFFFIVAGVFVRFVPISSMGWADELIELAFAWMVFLGASFLWGKRAHFRVEALPEILGPSKGGFFLQLILHLISLFFFVLLTWQGWVLTAETVDHSPILAWPRSFWFVIIPLTSALILGFIIRDLINLLRGKYLQS